MAIDGCDLLFLLSAVEEWREIVKENSWEGDDDDEGGEDLVLVVVSIEIEQIEHT